MGTASTKSRNSKELGRRSTESSLSNKSGPGEPPAPDVGGELDVSRRTWLSASAAILVAAAFLRFYDLDLVPLHHDEGVNGNFLLTLVRQGKYFYDPGNYHGPTLYYFAAVFPWLLRLLSGPNAQNSYGLTTVAIRFVPALFGLATVGLVFALRRNLGTIATLSAAGLLAISPGAVYLSRYFIHETLFVFFTLGIAVAALKYYEKPHPVYLILGAVSAALLFATKETAVISAAVLVIALFCTFIYRAMRRLLGIDSVAPLTHLTGKKKRRGSGGSRAESEWGRFVERVGRVGGPRNLTVWLAVAVAVFLAVNILFYSSFFRNYPKGVLDALKTFEFWTKTGKTAHVHPFVTYIWWLLLQESPLLLLGTVGALVAILKPVKPFVLFSAFWAFGLLAAYSLIAYKTPWLALNFIVPLALASGAAIQWLYDELGDWRMSQRRCVYAITVLLLVLIGPLPFMAGTFERVARADQWQNPSVLLEAIKKEPRWRTLIPGYQTVDLNFLNYDNDAGYYVYVYAHTRRETHKLLEEIDRIAERSHEGGKTGITIVAPEYWPLPWYLRDYSRVGYHGRISPSTEPVIIASAGQAEEVQATYGDRYQQVQSGFNTAGSFPLRPGVDLLLYTRRELVR